MSEPSYPIKLILQRIADFMEQSVLATQTDAMMFQKVYVTSITLRILANVVDEKAANLVQENAKMRKVLSEVIEKLRGEKAASREEAGNRLIKDLEAGLKTDGQDPAEENAILKETLVEAINGSYALSASLPEKTNAFFRQEIRSALRQQVDHSWAYLEGVPLPF